MSARTEISRSASAPVCFVCGTQTLLVRISPDKPGYDQRTYECPWCPHKMTEICCVNEVATRLMAKQHFSRRTG
jgi:hypothetical protein